MNFVTVVAVGAGLFAGFAAGLASNNPYVGINTSVAVFTAMMFIGTLAEIVKNRLDAILVELRKEKKG